MPESQTYKPLRFGILSKSEIIKLQQLKPINAIKDTLFSWMIIIMCITVASMNKYEISILCLISLIIGTQIYSLMIIAHDGLHRILFKKVWLNDLWNDLFILGSFGAITRINRINHMKHHLSLSLNIDPDRYKYKTSGRDKKIKFLLKLTGIKLIIKSIINVYLKPIFGNKLKEVNNSKMINMQIENYKFRDILIILIWQLILIISLTKIFSYWGYLLFWLLPLIIAYLLDLTRVFCEHSRTTNDLNADKTMRLKTIDVNLIEKLFLAPHNMNLHAAHHLWPKIPYYNLKEANNILKSRVSRENQNILWMPSYFKTLILFFNYAK